MAEVLSLTGFIRYGASRPFEWGECDCCLWAADWVMLRTGRDPAKPLRGLYRGQIGASRYVKRAGGYRPLVGSLMARAGFPETGFPMVGDVGLIDIDEGSGWAVAIKLPGRRWVAKAPLGVTVAPFHHIAAWSI